MITEEGFLKGDDIKPDGIAITFGKDMLRDHGGLRSFLHGFKECLASNDDFWIHWCRLKPKHDVIYVYIIICNRLAYRCQFGGWDHFDGQGYKANGDITNMKPGIILTGPLVRCPFKRKLRGFRSFRYTKKLF